MVPEKSPCGHMRQIHPTTRELIPCAYPLCPEGTTLYAITVVILKPGQPSRRKWFVRHVYNGEPFPYINKSPSWFKIGKRIYAYAPSNYIPMAHDIVLWVEDFR